MGTLVVNVLHIQSLAASFSTEELNAHKLSTLCLDKNLVGSTSLTTHNGACKHMKGWKDECVGDFRRCYSIPHDKGIFKSFLCLKKWSVPKGTTHISVDCTEDKVARLEPGDNLDPFFKQQEKILREMERILFVILSLLILMFGACTTLMYRWVIKPY